MTLKVLRVTALCYTIAAILAVFLLMAAFQTEGYSVGATWSQPQDMVYTTDER